MAARVDKRLRYKDNMRESARMLGKHPNFFSTTKRSTPEKFEYWLKLGDGNLYLGYTRYVKQFEQKQIEWQKIFYELHEKKMIFRISNWMYDKGETKQHNSFSVFISTSIFTLTEAYSWSLWKSMVKYKALYDEYMELSNGAL